MRVVAGKLAPRDVAPEHFVQLHLQAHRQVVLEQPVGEHARASCSWLGEKNTGHGGAWMRSLSCAFAHS